MIEMNSAGVLVILKTPKAAIWYDKDVRIIRFPHGSHICGLMPNRDREKKLYRMIPLIGVMYRTFGKYRKENLEYLAQSEKEIINMIRGE